MKTITFTLGVFIGLTILFASLTVFELTSSSHTATPNSTVTVTVDRTVAANRTTTIYQPFTPPPKGIVLRASINATTINPGRAISASAEVYNTLDERVTVTLNYSKSYFSYLNMNGWRNYNGGFDCVGILLVQLAVFRGHIIPSNFSSSVPLQIAPLIAIPCPNSPVPISAVFSPHSNVTGGICGVGQYCPTYSTVSLQHEECKPLKQGFDCSSVAGAIGVWDGTPDPTRSSYRPVTTGEYTVVAFDMWGQTQFLYFHVVNQ